MQSQSMIFISYTRFGSSINLKREALLVLTLTAKSQVRLPGYRLTLKIVFKAVPNRQLVCQLKSRKSALQSIQLQLLDLGLVRAALIHRILCLGCLKLRQRALKRCKIIHLVEKNAKQISSKTFYQVSSVASSEIKSVKALQRSSLQIRVTSS